MAAQVYIKHPAAVSTKFSCLCWLLEVSQLFTTQLFTEISHGSRGNGWDVSTSAFCSPAWFELLRGRKDFFAYDDSRTATPKSCLWKDRGVLSALGVNVLLILNPSRQNPEPYSHWCVSTEKIAFCCRVKALVSKIEVPAKCCEAIQGWND